MTALMTESLVVLDNCDVVHTTKTARIIVGNRKVAESADALRELRVTHVLNCAESQVERACACGDGDADADALTIKYLALDLDDAPRVVGGETTFDPRFRDLVALAVAFVDQAMQSGTTEAPANVLIHCAGGISRSASVALAFLVSVAGLSLKEAYEQVRLARPVIAPNAGFFCVLLDLERERHGRESMLRPKSMHQRTFTAIPDDRIELEREV
jgi:predicted protein tyrosine phosphatase